MNDKNANKVMELWRSVNVTESPIKKQLQLEIVNQIAAAFAIGQYYFMVFSFKNLQFEYVDKNVKNVLGIESKDFNLEFFFKSVHPEDLEKMHLKEDTSKIFLYEKLTPDEIPFYKVVYLLRLKDLAGNYKTILHQSRAINVSDDGKIQQVLAVHSDVTFLDIPFNHKISFISQNKPNYYAIEKDGKYIFEEKSNKKMFTKREVEIINKISEGKTYNEIADLLFLSPNTINFHKKKILKKSNCSNTAQLIAKCIRDGVI
jgi:DNA-binding CsgD family transcriptional regulator